MKTEAAKPPLEPLVFLNPEGQRLNTDDGQLYWNYVFIFSKDLVCSSWQQPVSPEKVTEIINSKGLLILKFTNGEQMVLSLGHVLTMKSEPHVPGRAPFQNSPLNSPSL